MTYNLWFSKKVIDEDAGKEFKSINYGEDSYKSAGYLIAADKKGNLFQLTEISDSLKPKTQIRDREAYIVAKSPNKSDFKILVNAKGEVKENIAKELGIEPNISIIKAMVKGFHEPITQQSSKFLNDKKPTAKKQNSFGAHKI